jgi:hypothetical protein
MLFTATRCACGFERLQDEEVSDHLLAAFACSCGFSAASGKELDDHFLTVFMPDDCLDPDGIRHSPIS